LLAVAPGGRQQVDTERLVGLPGHVFGDASPEIVLGDRRNVTERLTVPLGFVDGRLGDDRPSRASAAAFGAVGGECGDPGRTARQRVDVLVRRDPLSGR
jgi:hypothetical protein